MPEKINNGLKTEVLMQNNSEKKNEKIASSRGFIKDLVKRKNFSVIAILFILSLILTLATDNFLTQTNLFSVMRAFSFIAIIAIGQCFVIISAGVDLSVGSVFGLVGLCTAFLMQTIGLNLPLAIISGILIGTLVGFTNGILITVLKIPPFIATLGMLSVARGFAYALTTGYPIRTPSTFNMLGQGHLWIVPFPVVYMVVLAVIFTFILEKTVFGRRVFAIGGNEEAATISGINVKQIKLAVYALCGMLAGISGIITTARLGVAQSTSGTGYELDVIAAVIIGGASLTGGKGTVLGAVLGAAIMGVLRNGLILLNISPYWQQTVIGLVILTAIAGDQLSKRDY
jgi:ribose transport system permease protein